MDLTFCALNLPELQNPEEITFEDFQNVSAFDFTAFKDRRYSFFRPTDTLFLGKHGSQEAGIWCKAKLDTLNFNKYSFLLTSY